MFDTFFFLMSNTKNAPILMKLGNQVNFRSQITIIPSFFDFGKFVLWASICQKKIGVCGGSIQVKCQGRLFYRSSSIIQVYLWSKVGNHSNFAILQYHAPPPYPYFSVLTISLNRLMKTIVIQRHHTFLGISQHPLKLSKNKIGPVD